MILSRTVALLLALSAVNLALMVPGGLVETRSFPGYSVVVLIAFNVFLTVLGLGGLILSWRVWRSGAVGALSPVAGFAFTAVYLADLLEVFPVSTIPMPPLLATLEIIGTVLGIALSGFGSRAVMQRNYHDTGQFRLPPGALALLAALSVGIVIYATLAAK